MVSPSNLSVRQVLLHSFAALAVALSVIPAKSRAATLTLSSGNRSNSSGNLVITNNNTVITGPTGNLFDPLVLSNPIVIGWPDYYLSGLVTEVLDALVPGSGSGTLPSWGPTEIAPTLWDSGIVSYPFPSGGQAAQIGEPIKFSKFAPQLITIQNPGIVLTLGSNRPVATPPSALASFATDNEAPNALLTLSSGATFGVTAGGGSQQAGQLVQIDVAGDTPSVTSRADFESATTGANPCGPLRAGPGGLVYGLTRAGGAYGKGGIFRFNAATGGLEVVISFPADLVGVANSLVVAPDGTLYGTSSVLAEKGEIRRPLPPYNFGGPILLYNTPPSPISGGAQLTLDGSNSPALTLQQSATAEASAPESSVSDSALTMTWTPPSSESASAWLSSVTLTSSVRLQLTSYLVASPTSIYPSQLEVGAGFPDHGSIFRVSTSGQFEVLKTFHENEVVQTDVFAGPGYLAGTSMRISPGLQYLSYNPPIQITGPGTYRTAGGRWQYTPDSLSLPVQEGTLSPDPLIGTSKTYFPGSLGLTPDGHLLCSVSGGLYQMAPDGTGGQWVLDPAIVDVGPSIFYLTTNAVYNPGISYSTYVAPSTRVFGTYQYSSPLVRELVLREVNPTMESLPGGNLFVVAGNSEWEITPTGYVNRSIGLSRGAIGEGYYFGPWRGRRLTGPVFPYLDQRYRFESSSDTRMNVTALEEGRARPLADFSQVRAGALLAPDGAERDLLVVGRRREATSGWELFRLGRDANFPPVVSPISVAGTAGTLSSDDPPVRTIELNPLVNYQNGDAADANDDPLTLSSVEAPSRGVTGILSGNRLVYAAEEPLTAITFGFTVTDGHGGNTYRTVKIGPSAPSALDDEAVLVGYDISFQPIYRVAPLANDTDQQGLPLSALLAVPPAVGKVTADDDGFLITLKAYGTHPALTYLVTNGQRLSTAQITFPNRAPSGVSERTYYLNQRGLVRIPFADLAYDLDGDDLTFALTSTPSKGVITQQGDALVYQALEALGEGDQLTVTATDSHAASVVVTVKIISPENAFSGTLSGVIQKDGAPLGLLRLTATSSGKATALLTLGTRQYRGAVRPVGNSFAATLLGPNGTKFNVAFSRTSSGVSATVRIAGTEYNVTLTGEDLDSLGNLEGSYHLALTGDVSLPARYGFAILTQTANGQVKIVGRTPNGTPWSAAGLFDLADNFSFLAPIGTAGRTIGGTLHRAITNGETTLSGTIVWQGAEGSRELSVEGGRYESPDDLGFPFLGDTDAVARVEITPVGKPGVAAYFDVTESGKATVTDPTSRSVQIRFTPANGLFRGTIKLGGKLVPFTGLLGADGTSGIGMLLGPIGSVEVTAQ